MRIGFDFIKLATKLSVLFSEVRKHAEEADQAGLLPSKDQLSAFALAKLEGFDPEIDGVSVIGDEERIELSRAIAGITRRLIGAEQTKRQRAHAAESDGNGRKP